MTGLIWAAAAHASVLLENGNSLTISSGGVSLKLTVSNCVVNTSGSTGCTGANEIAQDGSYLGVVVQSTGYSTGSNLLDANSNNNADLNFELDITELSGPEPINSSTVSTNGAGDGTSAGLSYLSFSAPEQTAYPGQSSTQGFSPVSSFSEQYDLTADWVFSPTPTPYIYNLTQDFTASEPAGFGLLALGMGATMLLRRRRR